MTQADLKTWARSNWSGLLIVIFLICLPFQRRHIFFNQSPLISGQHTDFLNISLYATDLVIAALFLSLAVQHVWQVQHGRSIWNGAEISATTSHFWRNLYYILFTTFLCLILGSFIFLPRETPREYSLYHVVKWLELGFFAVVGAKIFKLHTKHIFLGLVLSGLVQSILAIAQFLNQKSIGLRTIGEQIFRPDMPGIAQIDTMHGAVVRAYGTFAHPNQLAGFLVVACATAVILFLKSNSTKGLYFYGFSIFLLAIGQASAFSRAGIAAFVLSNFIILVLLKIIVLKNKTGEERARNFNYRISLAAAVFLISTITAIVIYFPFLNTRFTFGNNSGGYTRAFYNHIGLMIHMQHPVFGAGAGNMVVNASKIIAHTQAWQVQPAHNYFIDVAAEFGAVGVILFVVFFGSLLYLLVRQYSNQYRGRGIAPDQVLNTVYLIAIFVAVIFLMQFDHYFYTQQQMQLLLWLMLGMILGTVL